jgi:large subunit ribosomal protein L22
MKLESAKSYLRDIIELKRAVPFKRYRRDTGHKKGKIAAGKYPQKVAKSILSVLENAEANADFKGLDTKKLVVKHIASHKGRVTVHRRKGLPYNCPTTNIEVILGEA